MCDPIGGVEQAVLQLGKQSSAMNTVLQSLVPKIAEQREPAAETSTSNPVKSPTLAQLEVRAQENRNEYLRKQLEAEREMTKQFEEAQLKNLPPVRVDRPKAPPGFITTDLTGETPVATPHKQPTPTFQQYQANRERQLWQGYLRTYEQDMQAQFMKALTKGPKMEFPKFDGTDPVGWIRQCNKYFQMSAAPEEYKVSLAQLYMVGEADVWLRRSGIAKKQLNWSQFGKEIIKRFSNQSSYDLTEKFNTLKQHNSSVSDYTTQFEDLMAEIQEENPELICSSPSDEVAGMASHRRRARLLTQIHAIEKGDGLAHPQGMCVRPQIQAG